MNPNAKEFVPAHILKQRQDEAQRLNNLTEQMNKVDLDSDNTKNESKSSPESNKPIPSSNTSRQEETEKNINVPEANGQKAKSKSKSGELNTSKDIDSNNINSHTNGDCAERFPDLEEEDDRFLLNAGENICEFNGEQFIIPGDDECDESQARVGYDFGNDEDNEDEDVQNAFEEFLDNLPDQ